MKNVTTSYITVERQARFSTWGNLTENTKYFWFVLHGSKMLSEQMLYKFSEFNPDEHFVVAPEALNKFYANGFGGDVVASWMTSRDRLAEIEDFSNYLSVLYSQFETQLPKDCKIILLGFSQGGTTLFRWLNAKQIRANNILGYSCWIPEDIDLKGSQTPFVGIDIVYTYGEQDEFLNAERLSELDDIIKKNNLDITKEPYQGKHRVDRNQLVYLFNKYIK